MKDDRIYLRHIVEAIQDIEQYASEGRDTFVADKMAAGRDYSEARSNRRGSQEPLRED